MSSYNEYLVSIAPLLLFPVVKRSTIWDDLWSTLETTLTGQRRPRKIPDHLLGQQDGAASNDIHLISPKLGKVLRV